MQKTIAPYLVSTYKMLQCVFPDGIDEATYLPLLAVLYDEMSDRSLAQVISEYMGKDYYIVLNDVYRIGATKAVPSETCNVVKQKLLSCGYDEWLIQQSQPIGGEARETKVNYVRWDSQPLKSKIKWLVEFSP